MCFTNMASWRRFRSNKHTVSYNFWSLAHAMTHSLLNRARRYVEGRFVSQMPVCFVAMSNLSQIWRSQNLRRTHVTLDRQPIKVQCLVDDLALQPGEAVQEPAAIALSVPTTLQIFRSVTTETNLREGETSTAPSDRRLLVRIAPEMISMAVPEVQVLKADGFLHCNRLNLRALGQVFAHRHQRCLTKTPRYHCRGGIREMYPMSRC